MKKLFVLAAMLAAIPLWAGAAGAQPGTSLAVINPVVACGGIGVAFDGTNILFTCAGDAVVHKTDLTGADLGGITITGVPPGAEGTGLDAIAWDPTEATNKLWGGNLDGAGNCRIWNADPVSGAATLQFTANDPNCSALFFDGITVDTVTGTLYWSPDVSDVIHHTTKAGAAVGPDIPFSALTGLVNSGLAIGIDGSLFAGTDGFGQIIQLDPTIPSVVGTFATVTGRDEDLECGPLFTKPDASTVETILSRDFETGRIDVLEAPAGTCQSPVVAREGCSPGYWKNHPDAWPAPYTPGTTLSGAGFTNTGRPSTSLGDALTLKGGSTIQGAKDILLRAAVAALLNAADPDVNYPLSVAQVIAEVNAALASGDRQVILDEAARLDEFNNLGCPKS
jgi:hypothetical protein